MDKEKMNLDKIYEALGNASSVIMDEYFRSIGEGEVAEDHDDEWFEMKEDLLQHLLEKAFLFLEQY